MTSFYLFFPVLHHRIKRVKQEQIRCCAYTLYGIQFGLYFLIILGGEAYYWSARANPLSRLPVFIMGMLAAVQSEFALKDAEAGMAGKYQSCEDCTRSLCGVSNTYALFAIWICVIAAGILEQIYVGPSLRSMGIPFAGYAVRILGEPALPILFYDLVVALIYPKSAEGGDGGVGGAAAGGPGRAARAPTALHAFLSTAPMRWLADISLGVYVVHETVIRTLVLLLYGPLERGAVQQAPWLILMPRWGAAVSLPLSILLGWLLTVGFERPLNKRIRAWAEGHGSRTGTQRAGGRVGDAGANEATEMQTEMVSSSADSDSRS